ncbi:MAG: GNAT family N-acetyltransferase [Anaerolineales bacterium]
MSEDFTGITGNKTMAAALVETWERLTGRQTRLKTAMRIYKLNEVKHVKGVLGRLRPMVKEDEEWFLEWYAEFLREVMEEEPDPSRVKKQVLRYQTAEKLQRGMMIWELKGKPVSMAGYSGPTPNGIRIGAVYTPPDLRRKGYASVCTAGLSQHLLSLGFQFCFLFTDLLNPTSNHIYQQIGYEAVCDVDQYEFLEKERMTSDENDRFAGRNELGIIH